MSSFLHRVGLATVRHRFATLAVWLVVLVAVGVGALTLKGTTTNSFSIPGQESTQALDIVSAKFGGTANAGTAQVAIELPAGQKVTDPANAAKVQALVSTLGKLPGVATASNPLDPAAPVVSRDLSATYVQVTYAAKPTEVTDAQREALFDAVDAARTGGLTVEVSGDVTTNAADLGGIGEIVGVVAALVVLAITYGALVAAGMNLLTALLGVGIGVGGVTALTGFVELSSTTTILAAMLGLAVGIDYALFIITRFRSELKRGRTVEDAAAMAVGTAGSAVVIAGLTVVIALVGLVVAGIPFITQMGLAAAGTVVIAVLVAITLVPAVLGFMGLRALPRKERALVGVEPFDPEAGSSPRDGLYAAWGRGVTHRRWPSLVAGLIVLAVIAIPVLSLRTSLVQHPETGSTQARAQAIIDAKFGPGVSGPLLVVVDGDGAAQKGATVAAAVKALPGVAFVTPPQPNADGSAALVTVIPTSAPDSTATEDLVHAVRDTVRAEPGAPAYVTGATAINVDVTESLGKALPIYLVLVVGLALILLVLVFRSVLVPVTGVVGFLLTIGAALGATTAVFQWGWLGGLVGAKATGPLLSLAPIIIVGILFGLAMDYQVFLVSRIHEAHAHGARPVDAIRQGFRQAAPVVLAAAAIMFAVFGGFASGHNPTVKPLAFALAVGVLFDAVVVRMIIMPAALAIMGGAAWWFPSWLRWLPRLDVEGAALEQRDVREHRESSDPVLQS